MDNKNETNQTVYIIYNTNDLSVSSFISYLVAALYRQGIDAVFDKTGHKLESIQFSDFKLFLVVFSTSYAFSFSCLENLVKLLEFLQKKDHVVVPVFYEKQQMNVFGEAFSMFEESYSLDQVTKWRCVLEKTMELQGHAYTDEIREQSEFIEEIARDISERLNPTEHIGIHRVLLELENLLCKQAWGFRSIGIYGARGIGKSTLAKAAFRRMSGGYDASRFIVECNENIVEIFSKDDFKEILMEKFDLNNQDLEPCYRRKRVLLALDDVQNTQDAVYFRGVFRRFGPGSLLIITSRDRNVLEECHVNEIYELKGLNKEDSMTLFTRCLYGVDVVEEKLPKLLVKEIERFDGNPFSIRSYAKKMKSKRTKYTEKALTKIRQYLFAYTINNIPFWCFEVSRNTLPITLRQYFLCTAAQNYQSDLMKLPRLDIPNGFLSDVRDLDWDLDFEILSVLKLLSRDIDDSLPCAIMIPHFGRETVPAYLLNKPRKKYKSFRDYTSMENIIFTDQLEPLQVLNLCCCIEIKHFPEFLQTIRELKVEGEILQWRLETDPLCNSATQTGSYLYCDFTFFCSIGTTISNRFHAYVKLTGSKAMKILSRVTWQISTYNLWTKRNHRLNTKSYRLARFRRFIRYITSLKESRRESLLKSANSWSDLLHLSDAFT